MHISNIRLGLATNSSSTHSIVFGIPSDVDMASLNNEINGGNSFGWEHFTLTTEDSKLAYVAVMIHGSLTTMMPSSYAKAVIKDLFGLVIADNDDVGIDHQSAIHFPVKKPSWGNESNELDGAFINDFIAYVKRKDVAILGGNDNDDDTPCDHGHLMAKGISEHIATKFSLLSSDSYPRTNKIIAKKDKGYWILFNPGTGAKMRLSFNENADPYVKATAPELVDVKITNFCPFGCEYCYQSSTTKGEHGNNHIIDRVTCALDILDVFEVAIGGGEPTLHPNFHSIIRSFRLNGIVPNFTTRNLGWLINDELVEEIKKAGSAIAFSVDDPTKLKQVYAKFEAAKLVGEPGPIHSWHGDTNKKLVFQYVMGSSPSYNFESLLRNAYELGCSITLLGYKKHGFGESYKPQDYSDWLKTVAKLQKEYKCPRIGIDTALANEYKKELSARKELSTFVQYEEGTFSMYIDAVEGVIAPSSYCDKSKYVKLDTKQHDANIWAKSITDAFAKFQS